MEHVIMSDSPHVRCSKTTRSIMIDVLIALLPAAIMGCIYFGWKALLVLALSTLTAVISEFIYLLIMKKSFKDIIKQFDFTSVVTGLLLGMTLSCDVPFYVPILASIFAIIVVKMLFGGTGKNIVNPAITGRIFAFIAFTGVMTTYTTTCNIGPIKGEITTGATFLTDMLQNGKFQISNLDLFLGTGLMGCIGETCKLALLIGGIYLVIRKVIKWQWPVIYILVTGLMSAALYKDFGYFLPSILSGGLFLGAIFMATDYVTSPSNDIACYIYYVLLGIVTAVLRKATSIEVVSFAILLMNLIVPLLNTYIRPRAFGAPSKIQLFKEKQAAKAKAKAEKAKESSKEAK